MSVIAHYYVKLRLRSGSGLSSILIAPALGASICFYVWTSLSSKAMVAGFCWLALGTAYCAVLTRGFRRPAVELEVS